MIWVATLDGCAELPAATSRRVRETLPDAKVREANRPLGVAGESDIIDVIGFSDPAVPLPKMLKNTRKPTVCLIGDDPGTPNGMGGPDNWSCSEKLSRWARAVIVHAAGPEIEHYAEAVRAARSVGRVAMIETTSANAQAWVERLNCPRTLLILPRGGLHPVPAERGEEQ